MSRLICIIQAREGSTRLPGKSLLDLAGKPLIAHVVQRAQAIRGASVVCAIPEGDDQLRAVVEALPCAVFQGSAEDVLSRYVQAAGSSPLIMRVTGDCPLLAPEICGETLRQFMAEGADFGTNDTLSSGWPDGTDVEVFSRELLHRAQTEALPEEREHVTAAMRRLVGVRAATYRSGTDYSALKLSVDTADDFERVQAVFAQLPPDAFSFTATITAAKKAGVWT